MLTRQEWARLGRISPVVFMAIVGMVMLFDAFGKAGPFTVIVVSLAILTLLSSFFALLTARTAVGTAIIALAVVVAGAAVAGAWIITLY